MQRVIGNVSCALLLTTSCVELPQWAPGSSSDAASGFEDHKTQRGSVRLGSWNVRRFGLEARKDSAGIARIIDAHYDLIALHEVMWATRDEALSALLAALPASWRAQITATPRPNIAVDYAECYVVLYRVDVVAPCGEYPELRYIDDGDGTRADARPDRFLREPALGCYRLSDALGAGDFLLATYHARWGDGRVATIAQEVRELDRVLVSMRALFPAEAELFLVGDLNLGARDLAGLTQARDRTEGVGSTLTMAGEISENLYDHLLAWGDAANQALADDAHVLDVRPDVHALDVPLTTSLSDHLPIQAQLTLAADRD